MSKCMCEYPGVLCCFDLFFASSSNLRFAQHEILLAKNLQKLKMENCRTRQTEQLLRYYLLFCFDLPRKLLNLFTSSRKIFFIWKCVRKLKYVAIKIRLLIEKDNFFYVILSFFQFVYDNEDDRHFRSLFSSSLILLKTFQCC